MTLSPGQGLPQHAHRHQGTVSPPLHTCFHQVSPQDKGPKLWALQATGLHVEIKEEFIAPTLALFFFRYTKLWSKSDSNCSWLFSHRRTLLCCWIWQEDNSLSQSQKDSSYFSWCQLRSTFILALIVARLKRPEEDTK